MLVKCNSVLLKIAIEIVDLPIKHVDFAKFFVCLPEDDRYTVYTRAMPSTAMLNHQRFFGGWQPGDILW